MHLPSKAAWAHLPVEDRLRWLENLGEVPEYGEIEDYQLAQKTSWWGKPLDPKEFWKNRVVWLDKSADSAARRHGRSFPPIPYDDPSLPRYKNDPETHPGEGTIEGPNLDFHWTGGESAFWNKFTDTHPLPPESIEKEQLRVAYLILSQRFAYERGINSTRTTP